MYTTKLEEVKVFLSPTEYKTENVCQLIFNQGELIFFI